MSTALAVQRSRASRSRIDRRGRHRSTSTTSEGPSSCGRSPMIGSPRACADGRRGLPTTMKYGVLHVPDARRHRSGITGAARRGGRVRVALLSRPLAHSRQGARHRFLVAASSRREYSHTLDLFVSLTAAAAATTELRRRHPVSACSRSAIRSRARSRRRASTIVSERPVPDLRRGRRLERRGDGATTGPTRARGSRCCSERVEAVRAIWSHDEAYYHGRFVDFDGIWSWQKPVQEPHPPILLAGNGPRALDRVLAYADGWAPLHEPGLGARIEELLRRAGNAGRDVTVTVFGAALDARDLDAYAAAGVERSSSVCRRRLRARSSASSRRCDR